MMLYVVCCGKEVGVRNRVFFRVTSRVFPCNVAVVGDESYLVCAAVAAGVIWFLLFVL